MLISKEKSILVKKKLLDLGMTQVDLAKLFGITRQQLNNILNGKSEHLKLEEKILNWYDTGK